VRVALAGAIAIVGGVVYAYLFPRGPLTTEQALLTIAAGLVIGVVGASVSHSAWSVLLAPLGFVTAFELTRRGFVSGPTVDSAQFETFYGVLAVVLGRAVLLTAGVVPMMLGATVVLSRRRAVAVVSVLVTGAIAIAALLPASTPPIVGADGKQIPASIASLERVALGGHEQWIMMRGHSTENPVLLYLSGGPGQSDLPYVRVLFANLEPDFVVVGWDQRGTGKSYPALDPTSTLTLDQAVSDTIELTDLLRARFDEPKIYLVGESWGSILGALAAQRRPDLYHAVIGSGQMVSVRETDRRLYSEILKLAEAADDTALAQTMRSFGEPPYRDPFANAFVMQQYDKLYKPYTPPESLQRLGATAAWETGPWGVLGREYNAVEKVSVMRGLMDMFSVMYPQLQGIDFRRDVRTLGVEYVMLDGAAELSARRDLALEWYAQLDAPRKRIFTFENAAHSVAQEQFVAFRQILLETVVPETRGS
jgi:pimeloyl-ACP methyl ester carboxylesterase